MGRRAHAHASEECVRPIHLPAERGDDLPMFIDTLHLTELELTSLVAAVVGVLASTQLGYRIGQRRDRSLLGVVLGALLFLPGLLIIAVMPHKEPEFY